MKRLEEVLVRALDLASNGDVEAAREVLLGSNLPEAARLAVYLERQQKLEAQQVRDLTRFRHEIGNELSIAKASIEAMLDGIVGVTDSRLNRIREIIVSVSELMYEATERRR